MPSRQRHRIVPFSLEFFVGSRYLSDLFVVWLDMYPFRAFRVHFPLPFSSRCDAVDRSCSRSATTLSLMRSSHTQPFQSFLLVLSVR